MFIYDVEFTLYALFIVIIKPLIVAGICTTVSYCFLKKILNRLLVKIKIFNALMTVYLLVLYIFANAWFEVWEIPYLMLGACSIVGYISLNDSFIIALRNISIVTLIIFTPKFLRIVVTRKDTTMLSPGVYTYLILIIGLVTLLRFIYSTYKYVQLSKKVEKSSGNFISKKHITEMEEVGIDGLDTFLGNFYEKVPIVKTSDDLPVYWDYVKKMGIGIGILSLSLIFNLWEINRGYMHEYYKGAFTIPVGIVLLTIILYTVQCFIEKMNEMNEMNYTKDT